MKGSWKDEFDVKYRRALNTTDITIMDYANIILTIAIDNLDAMMACEGYKKGRFQGAKKGIWNPKTNKCKRRK